MIKANFNAYNNYVTDSLYQWDIDQDLVIHGLNLTVAPEVRFCNANMDKAIARQSTLKSGIVTVRIPNSLLQVALTIKAYVGIYDGSTFTVIETVEIPVIATARPSDYSIQDSDEEVYSFVRVENKIANMVTISDHNIDIRTLNNRVANIVANSDETGNNSELIDIRTANDGTIYATAGDAVRGQANKLSKVIKDAVYPFLNSPTKLVFFKGAINYNEPDEAVLNRAHTMFFMAHESDRVYCENDTYEYRIGRTSIPYFSRENAINWINGWTTSSITLSNSEQNFITILVRKKADPEADISGELTEIANTVKYISIHNQAVYNGLVGNDYGVTSLKNCVRYGWYGFGQSDKETISDLPIGYPNAGGTLIVQPYTFKSNSSSNFILQTLITPSLKTYKRLLLANNSTAPTIFTNWTSDFWNELAGKRVAIIGDSISTNGTAGDYANKCELKIEEQDVGVSLNAYLTYYDVQAGLSLGGHTFTTEEIGQKVTFTPTLDDVGKVIGLASNWNPSSVTVWWEVAQKELGFIPIPVCWSGASITSHESDKDEFKASHAWHPATMRKCGERIPGTMSWKDPDVIIIYRGVNDFSHSPYTKLTEGYFNNPEWDYPTTDAMSDGAYGYKEGMCLTIKKIRDMYPTAKIFLCTLNVFKRVNYSHYPTNNGLNTLPQYNNAIREIADFMGCGLIEFDKDGITFENCYTQGYITDSPTTPTHPSDKGHNVMGLKAIADLKAQYSKI